MAKLLDHEKSIRKQLRQLSGDDLEYAVSAVMQFLGYVVLRKLRLAQNGDPLGDVDVLAFWFCPDECVITAIECTGTASSDLLKFASVSKLLHPRIRRALYVADARSPKHEGFLKQAAEQLEVQWLRKGQMLPVFAPLLGPIPEKRDTTALINQLVNMYREEDRLLQLAGRHPLLGKHQNYFLWQLWHVEKPVDQVRAIWEVYEETRTLGSDVAEDEGLDFKDEIDTGDNDLIQAALLLQYLHRLFNVLSVARLAVETPAYRLPDLIKEIRPGVLETVNSLQQNRHRLEKFASFFQHWTQVWGGYLLKSQEEKETAQIARELHMPKEDVPFFIEVIERHFCSRETGRSLLGRKGATIYFWYLPMIFKLTGAMHRRQVFAEDEDYLRELEGLSFYGQLVSYYRRFD